MTRMFQLLAVPLILAALALAVTRPTEAQAQAQAQTPPAAYGAIARTALASLGQHKGECFIWVRSVVKSALNRTIGYDYHGGYLEAGAVEVPLISARDGDIIQIANPGNTKGDAEYPGLHTAIVLDNLGNGKFRVIDSNSNHDGMVRIRNPYVPSELVARYPGTVIRVYRFDGSMGTGPVIAPPPLVTAPAVIPPPADTAPGVSVAIAADGDCLRARSAAGLGGSVLGCLPSGSRVTVLQNGPTADGYRWVQVTGGNVTGWVAANYLSTAAPPSVNPSTIAAAITPPPPPPRGTFAAKPVFGAGIGQATSVFLGGPVDDLVAAATEARASGVWVQNEAGEFNLLIVGGPSFIVEGFRKQFSVPFPGPVAVTLIGNGG